ncbi:hypothetical protein DFJ73DRAFT_870541 [Zopfochytrium polystomum]|nr:hypothetical protein DFJ73DRAFT_870541 [Zopfochytrium polystomum]
MSARTATYRIATVMRTTRKTRRRDDAKEAAEIKSAHMAALICCLFPLMDAGVGSAGGPGPAPVGVGPALPARAVTEFRRRLQMNADVMKTIPRRREQCFAAAAKNFLTKTAPFSPAQLSDPSIVLTLVGNECDKEVKSLNLDGKESDSLFLSVVELFITTVKEAISKESNAQALFEYSLFKSHDALKNHLFKFLTTTDGIQGGSSTSLADWLRIVFQLKPEVHNKAVVQVRAACSERVGFSELDYYVKQLENRSVPSAPEKDFATPDLYEEWRQKELALMQGFRRAYLARHQKMKPLDESTSLFSPPEPKKYYKIILSYCLMHDMSSAAEGDKAQDMDLSKNSKNVLNECAMRWHLSKEFREFALMEAAVDQHRKSILTISDIVGRLDTTFAYMSKQFSRCRMSDLEIYLSILRKLETQMKSNLDGFVKLMKGDPMVSRKTMSDTVYVLEKLNKDPVWISYNNASEDLEGKVIPIIEEAILARYTTLDQQTNNQNEILRIKQLVRSIRMDLDRFSTHFPDPILGNFYIRNKVEARFLQLFNVEMENLRYHFERNDATMDDVLGPDGLYHEVSDLYRKVDCIKLGIDFNTEEWFRPYIQEWLNRTDDLWEQWAENACDTDTYTPILAPTTMYSVSVRDVFSFFSNGLKFMANLKGIAAGKKDDMVIKFLRMMGKSLQRYSEILKQDFEEWEEINDDIPVEFHKESCIKLNNIIGCLVHLKYIFEELGLDERRSKMNPNATRRDYVNPGTKYDHIWFTITIVRAYDLQICDFTSSDPFVVIMEGKRELMEAKTKTIHKNLNPVWNEMVDLCMPKSKSIQQSFLDFLVYDEDPVGMDLCGRTNDDKLFLRETRFEDYLTHDVMLRLEPQGRLLVRVMRHGEIADVDFWMRKSKQILTFTAETMVRTYADKVTRYVYSIICKIAGGYKSSFFSSSIPPVTEASVEREFRPAFVYLDRNLTLLNENLDRPLLNQFLRDHYPELSSGLEIRTPGQPETPADKARAADEERDAPSLVCRVIWIELVTRIYNHLNAYGKARGENESKKRNTAEARSGKRQPLTEAEQRQVSVFDIALEFLKAFFYCDIEGRNCGFSLSDLEDKMYLDTRALIRTLLQSQPSQ